jgi:hypothetical protein
VGVTLATLLVLGQAQAWSVEPRALESWLREPGALVIFASALEPDAVEAAQVLEAAAHKAKRVTHVEPVTVLADGEPLEVDALKARGQALKVDTVIIVRERVAEPGTAAVNVLGPRGTDDLLVMGRGRPLPRNLLDAPLSEAHLTWQGPSVASSPHRLVEGAEFYRVLGRDDLAGTYLFKSVLKGGFIGLGAAALIVGVIVAYFGITNPPCLYGGGSYWGGFAGCWQYDNGPAAAGILTGLVGVAAGIVGAVLKVDPMKSGEQRTLVEQHNAVVDRE